MGFFSKIFKGVKKVFKKIGKGIKKVVTKVGKVVGKLGIVGQIGLMFILPGVGGVLAKGFGALTGGLLANAGTGIIGAAARGLGHVLATAGKFASTVGNVFKSVTDAVGGFVKNVGGKVLEKAGIKTATEGTLTEAFQTWMGDTAEGFGKVLDPFSKTSEEFAASLIPKPTEAAASMTAEESSIVETSSKVSTDNIPKVNGDFKDATLSRPEKVNTGDLLNIETSQRTNIMNEVTADIAKEATASQGKGIMGFLDKDVEFLGAEFNVADEARRAIIGQGRSMVNSYIRGVGQEEPEEYTPRGDAQYSYAQPIQMAQDYYNQNGMNYGATPMYRAQTQAYDPLAAYNQSLNRSLQPLKGLRG